MENSGPEVVLFDQREVRGDFKLCVIWISEKIPFFPSSLFNSDRLLARFVQTDGWIFGSDGMSEVDYSFILKKLQECWRKNTTTKDRIQGLKIIFSNSFDHHLQKTNHLSPILLLRMISDLCLLLLRRGPPSWPSVHLYLLPLWMEVFHLFWCDVFQIMILNHKK